MDGGILKLVAELDGEFYTISQVAEKVGRHPDTIRRWIETGKVSPPKKKKKLGKKGQYVWLYTQEEIAAYKEYASKVRSGRPRKTT